MEKHEDYSMCFHNAYEIFEHKNVEKKLFSNIEDKDYTGVDIYKDWIVPTASTLFRREILSSELYLKAIENKTFIYGDIVLFLSCANYGKLRGMSDIMSVYRRHENGITYQLNTHQKQYTLLLHQLEIYKYFGKEYKTVSLYYFQRGCFTIFNGSLKKEFKDIQFRFLLIGLKESILYGIYNYSKLTFPAIIKRLSGRKSFNHHE